MRNFRVITSWAIAIGAALAIGGTIYQQLNAPSTSDQQTIISSTTRVVVVLIPGFPIESIALGALLGLTILMIFRRLQSRNHHREELFETSDESLPSQDRLNDRGFQ